MADRIVICMPIFNDWESLVRLLAGLDEALADLSTPIDVLVLDDASDIPCPESFPAYDCLRQVEILHLRRNLGHQRAIAIGISYVHAELPCRALLIMDGDGEDPPAGARRLIDELERSDGKRAIFAARARRAEGLIFRLGYVAYKILHRLLTGRSVRVGNFSILPWGHVHSLVVCSDLWNHYAATVYKTRLPVTTVPIARAVRYSGQSSMNLVGFVVHGLSAISVFSEGVGVRLLFASFVLIVASALGVGTVVGIRLLTDLAIPGWATYVTGFLGVLMLQAFLLSLIFVFVTLSNRHRAVMLPARDFLYFIDRADLKSKTDR